MSSFDASSPLNHDFQTAISTTLEAFLQSASDELCIIGDELAPMARMAGEFTTGGKRLRPAFCYWGHAAVAGQPDTPEQREALLRASASLDLLHVSALIHDDVMDASDTRRGMPAAHRQFEALHQQIDGRGSAESFGRAGAILLGDLLIMWSVQLLANAGVDSARLAAAQPLVEVMRNEVTAGQFLDVIGQARADSEETGVAVARANRVVEYKSARYSVRRPVQFGAALGGAEETQLSALGRYGSPLGRAFQFRDDLLGVFGDEALTGKPAGDDLREGKRTVLIAHALDSASAGEATELDALLGDPDITADQIERGRHIIDRSGARQRVEETIDSFTDEALTALDQAEFTSPGRQALTLLAEAAVRRRA